MNSNFKIGDKVRFLNETGGGVITSFTDKDNAMVMTEYGFEIPYNIKNLVKIDSDQLLYTNIEANNKIENITEIRLNQTTNKPRRDNNDQISNKPDHFPEPTSESNDNIHIFYPDPEFDLEEADDINVFFAFVPVSKDLSKGNLKAYLINDSQYTLMYNYLIKTDELVESKSAGVLEANTKVLLEEYNQDQINDLIDFAFQFIFYAKGCYRLKKPVHIDLEINPVKYYRETSYRENDFFENEAFIFHIVKNDSFKEKIESIDKSAINNILIEKNDAPTKSDGNKSEKPSEFMEVDLHIHELIDNTAGLSNQQMLDIQINHFKKKLDEAIKNKVRRVIFIHGIGNGKLKNEIRQLLNKMNFIFNDASFKEYGYGATMVLIEQNKTYLID